MKLEIFFVVLLLTISTCVADDEQAIRDLCRFRIGTFPHPNPQLCNLFVQCTFLNGNVIECPAREIFVEGDGCVPGNINTCQRIDPPNNENVCEDINIGIIPDPTSCTRFILCVFFTPEFLTCPPETPVFDTIQETCVAGNPNTCEIFTTTLPPPTTTTPAITTTTSSPAPEGICRGNILRRVADPNSCYRYYLCILGSPRARECSEGRIFVESVQVCLRGDRDTCVRRFPF